MHHCSQCNRCIYFRDHHCHWISNCVGYNNIKFFVLFTLYVAASALLNCYVLLCNFYFVNPLREDIDGIRSLINIFTHKFDIENLWIGKPLAFVDDILITSSWGFFAYAFFVAYYTCMKVYLDRSVILTNKRSE